MKDSNANEIRPEVLTYDDIRGMVPFFDGRRGLVEGLMHLLKIDEVNAVHSRWCSTPGVAFAHALVHDEFKFKLRVDNIETLAGFKDGPFITVSNHPFGSYDGFTLVDIVGTFRPDFKVMVNLVLNQIRALRPVFIAVDPMKSDDPEKKKVTMQGIREAMRHVREGHPLGFFPAGAVSKLDRRLRLVDRPWQPSIIRLIQQLAVPVIPIYFHPNSSWPFKILGVVDWRLRTLDLPRELFKHRGAELHVSVGNPISVEQQKKYATVEDLGRYLRDETYALSLQK